MAIRLDGTLGNKMYKSLEEWKKDMKIIEDHPNDRTFINLVTSKVNQSEEKVRNAIKSELESAVFEKDEYRYVLLVSKDCDPNKMLLVKSKSNPWFEV